MSDMIRHFTDNDANFTRIQAAQCHIPTTAIPENPVCVKYSRYDKKPTNNPYEERTIPRLGDLLQWQLDLNRASLDSSGIWYIEFQKPLQR